MIFWILLIVFIIAVIGAIITNHFDLYDDYEGLFVTCVVIAIICGLILAIMVGVITTNRVNENAELQAYKTRYDMLVYQYENDFYENDNDIGKYQLLQDITAWNEEISKNKKSQHNIWISIFVPHIYDELDLIKIDGGKE